MSKSPVESYRQHEVWDAIELKSAALETVKYAQADTEERRTQTLVLLQTASKSRSNPLPVLFDDTLDTVRDAVNQLAVDERSFEAWVNQGNFNTLRAAVRDLPGPRPAGSTSRYLDALDAAIALREQELEKLREALAVLETSVSEKSETLEALAKNVQRQQMKIEADAATITQVAASADEQLRVQWETKLAAWEQERESRDLTLNQQMADQIALLSTAALTGRRLVEQAAGHLTATDWASRAKRERWNAHGMRWAAFGAFGLAIVLAAWVLWTAIDRDLALSVGDGILRGAIVLALAGVGSFLTVESRRHFREADSAEDVTLALVALEPFYAGSGDQDRAGARQSLGDTVFIRNTLSRFSSRDSTKNGALTNEQLNQVVDLISKGADVAAKSSRTAGT